MSTHPALSPLCDPIALGRLQILLIPIQPQDRSAADTRLSQSIFTHWSTLFKRYTTLRSDDIVASTASGPSHVRGGASGPRQRFLPVCSATSVSKANTSQHVHLAFPSHPPARHLYPLNLLRLTTFPLVVIGIALDPGDDPGASVQTGYSLGGEENGDVGEASTPRLSGQNATAGTSSSAAFEETLASLFPPSSAFPFVKRLILVPPILPKSPNPNPSPRKGGHGIDVESRRGNGKGKEREDVRCAPTEGSDAWVGRLLGELVGDVLGELGELATALETPTGLKTLSSTLLPSLSSTMSSGNALFLSKSTGPNHVSRASTSTPTLPNHSLSVDTLGAMNGSMGITLNRALTPGGRPTSVQPTSATPVQSPISIAPETKPASSSSNPFRISTAISSPFSRTSSAASVLTTSSAGGASLSATKYTSATLTGVAGGRLMKLLGDMYLLVGMYGDAIKCYDDGAERCRVVGDVLWEACAREGRAAAGIGESWEARDGSDKCQSFSASPIPIEIMAHYLSAISCLSRAPLPYPPTILSPSPQAVSGTLALPAPSAPGSVHLGTGEGLLAYLYSSLSLQISHFQLVIWATGGWGSIALSCLMTHTLPRSFPPPLDEVGLQDPYARRRRHRFLALLSSRSGITRQLIFSHAESAVGPLHRAMTRTEQLTVHVEIVWLARWLDLPRHEAVYTREVVKRLGVLIVDGREESRRIARAGFRSSRIEPVPPSSDAVGLGLGMPVSSTKELAVRRKESTEGNAAVMLLMERIIAILGVNLLPPLSTSTPLTNGASTRSNTSPSCSGFGWPEIQVDTAQSLITVAEHLADQEMVIRLALSALKGLNPYLSPGSQSHLIRMAGNAVGTLKRRGRWSGGLEWWIPGKVVLSLEVAALSPNKIPAEHSLSEIVAKGKKNQFLYDPRIKSVNTEKNIIVANEQVDIFVTLSNPFAFDLDIADLSLITSGVQFTTNPLPLILPANSVQTVRVTGNAPSHGLLQIQGVSIRLPDGSSDRIYLPVVDEKARAKREKRRSKAAEESSKMKRSGTEARFAQFELDRMEKLDQGSRSKGDNHSGELQEGEKWLECQVVRDMPLLWVKRSNLTHGTVMLYDGESTTIRLTLENSSSTPVNFLKISYEDNTTRQAQALLNEELTAKDAYEVEHDMLMRPVFASDAAEVEQVEIGPGSRHTVSIRCLGRVGCTDGCIRVDYGNIDRSVEEVSDRAFHTRQIVFPVLFTVYQTLELYDLDVLRLPSNNDKADFAGASRPNGTAISPKRSPLIERNSNFSEGAESGNDKLRVALEQSAGECLAVMSVRNVYGVPFEVCLGRQVLAHGKEGAQEESRDEFATSRLVPPGATERYVPCRADSASAPLYLSLLVEGTLLRYSRLIIPISRLSLTPAQLSQPIPALSSRQYVIDKTGRTQSQIKQDLQLFWYREELLRMLKVTWLEPGSRRRGETRLRGQVVDWGMVGVLRVEEVEVNVCISNNSAAKEGDGVKAGDFAQVVVEVINHLERPIVPRLRLEPVPTHESTSQRNAQPRLVRHIVFDGILSTLLQSLKPGEKGSHSVGAIFLAEGSFAFRAIVEDESEVVETGGVWVSQVANVRVV